jgi:hypothetical protein
VLARGSPGISPTTLDPVIFSAINMMRCQTSGRSLAGASRSSLLALVIFCGLCFAATAAAAPLLVSQKTVSITSNLINVCAVLYCHAEKVANIVLQSLSHIFRKFCRHALCFKPTPLSAAASASMPNSAVRVLPRFKLKKS